MSVLVLTLIVTMLSVLVIGLVVAQTRPTLFTNKNTRTISAAQAGIDSAIAQIRNASTTDGSGNTVGEIHDLPCVVQGTVEDSVGKTTYKAEVSYFNEDPEGKDDAWRNLKKLKCYEGPSAFGLKAVPYYALVKSVGADEDAKVMAAVADRTLEATYTFPLITRNISGGLIMDSNSQFCLVADSASVNSYITYQPADSADCKNPSELSSWSWRSDYMIHLSSSDLGGRVPLCLSGRATGSTPKAMRLQVCTTTTKDPDGQRFAWTGEYTWKGQNANNTADMASYVVNIDSIVNAGDYIAVSNGYSNPKPIPLPSVGKGNASKATDQVVNQLFFGRCLDVTDEDAGKAFMITFPCKQDPSGKGNVPWNHKWYVSEPDATAGEMAIKTTISVKAGGTTKNCLITTSSKGLVAGTLVDGASIGGYKPYMFPRFKTSSGTIDCSSVSAQWTRYGETGDPMTSWTLVDANGLCLSADGPYVGTKLTAAGVKSVVVQTCNGKNEQKWNVPEDPTEAYIGNYEEKTGRTD